MQTNKAHNGIFHAHIPLEDSHLLLDALTKSMAKSPPKRNINISRQEWNTQFIRVIILLLTLPIMQKILRKRRFPFVNVVSSVLDSDYSPEIITVKFISGGVLS